MSRKRTLMILILTTILHNVIGAPYVNFDNLNDEFILPLATDTAHRLPTDFIPERYDIEISDIKLEDKVFTGTTAITFKCLKATNILKLHISDISFFEVNVNIVGVTNTSLRFDKLYTEDKTHQMIEFVVQPSFTEGHVYKITFNGYTGLMSHNMQGFYVSKYANGNETILLGTTQMQPTHARKVFPCFDEPMYKAKFKLSIRRPSGFEPSISNMKINPSESDALWDRFHETPLMSTYLLAFIVSNFKALEQENVNDNLFRVVGRQGADGQGKYAFNSGREILSAMNKYMNLSYYAMGNTKMDQAAIPDFSAGAMENWGLLTYREAYLLSTNNSSVRYKQQINGILAHEEAHMWFGDYVTCHWWSDTWLNEGFARFFQYKLPDMVEPEFKMMTQFPVVQLHAALAVDTTVRSVPLTNVNVNSPSEISNHFGTISYNKGASIIRMMEAMIGEENFQNALQQYIKDNANGVVEPDILYSALQDFAPENRNISVIMSSWVGQSGFPVVNVNIDRTNKKMTLSQKRMKKPWEKDLDTVYEIPITYATKSKTDFNDTTVTLMLSGKDPQVVDIEVGSSDWVVLNKQQKGYYRVNYDDNSWGALRVALLTNDRNNIHELNRAQIVDDVLNLAREDLMSYNMTLDMLDFLALEVEYPAWTAAFTGFSYIRQQLNTDRKLLQKLDEHILNLMKGVIANLTFTDDGDYLTQLFRMQAMNFACSLGHPGCVDYSTKMFNNYTDNDTPIPPNHREFVYCTGLRQGDEESYNKLWDKFVDENLVNEQLVILGALGCSTNKTKIHELLDEIMKTDSLIRDQDTMTPINSILNGNLDNPEFVLSYIEEPQNFLAVRKKLGSYTTLFTSLGSKLTGHQGTRFQSLIMDNSETLTKEEIAAGLAAYSNLAQQGNYIVKAGRQIEAWLSDKYGSGRGGASGLGGASLSFLAGLVMVNLVNSHL